jgi:hypothetical protein
MKKIVTLLIISVILSCQNTTSPVQPNTGEEFEIVFGKQITIPEEGISLQFSDVLVDSRCPKGVTCVWAGNAEIVIQLNDSEANLNTYLEPQKTNIYEYKIQFLSLNPYPKYNVKLKNKDYSAKLLKTKN